MSFQDLLKKIPLDLAQGEVREKTFGKKIALSYVNSVKNKTALDVGCAYGLQSKWLEKKGYEVTSIDVVNTYPKAIIHDVNKPLPFKDNSFDLIWCSEVIEHLDSPRESIREFNRVLKPNGKMVITTPNSYFWLYKIAKLFGKNPKDIQNPTHKHFFRYRDVKLLFPFGKVFGYFPYFLFMKQYKISKHIGFLSPTFIIISYKWLKNEQKQRIS